MRALLVPDLENIEQVMVEKQNDRLKVTGKASTALLDTKSNPKRKASGPQSGGLSDQVSEKAHSEKFFQHCKAHGGPYQMHITNNSDCRCYNKDGKFLGAAAGKPSKSKKPYKKFGGNKNMAFMQTMFEAYAKAKKASKSKKPKKRGMTLVAVPTVNRELGGTTRVFA
jgi:hypothetical protein